MSPMLMEPDPLNPSRRWQETRSNLFERVWQETCLSLGASRFHDVPIDATAPATQPLLPLDPIPVFEPNLPATRVQQQLPPLVIHQYERIKQGPEQALMERLKAWGLTLLTQAPPMGAWAGVGLTVGAGDPDLLLVKHSPQIRDFVDVTDIHCRVLACVREASGIGFGQLEDRMKLPGNQIRQVLGDLLEKGILEQLPGGYGLSTAWRTPLQEVIAIEAKVSKWRDAANQAARNTIFAHKSYVALPLALATRVASDPIFDLFRIGVLGIEESGTVLVIKEAPIVVPSVWYYHYHVANVIARTKTEPQIWPTSSRLRKPNADIRNTNLLGH